MCSIGVSPRQLAFVVCLAIGVGCTGDIAAVDGEPVSTPTARPAPPAPGADPLAPPREARFTAPTPPGGMPPQSINLAQPIACTSVGPRPLRRLTAREYDRSVSQLLGDSGGAQGAWVTGTDLSGFDNDATALATQPTHINQFTQSAEAAAQRALRRLTELLPCAPTADDACADTFIESFARRAYRRPLLAGDRSRLRAIYKEGKVLGGFSLGIQLIIETVLQSPAFLYRIEGLRDAAPKPGAIIPLTPQERATRLSFFLWGSPPDAALAVAADTGKLDTDADLQSQIDRLLADPRARQMGREFHEQWLELNETRGITRDPKLFPTFRPHWPEAIIAGTQAFVSHVMFDSPVGTLGHLLTADFAFATFETATLLDVRGPKGDAPEKVTTDKTQRAGLLTDLALLTGQAKFNRTAPVFRGKFVRERLLCQNLLPPPADLQIDLPKPDPKLTTREMFAQHSVNPACKGCHAMMDPIGFGFETYDAIGRYRQTENGKAIDARGELLGTQVSDGTFVGAVGLAQKLSQSPDVAACMTRQWFRFAFGHAEGPLDQCALADIQTRFSAGGFNLRQLLVAIAKHDAFNTLLVTPADPQGCTP